MVLEPVNHNACFLGQCRLVELGGRDLLGVVLDVLLQDKTPMHKGLNMGLNVSGALPELLPQVGNRVQYP